MFELQLEQVARELVFPLLDLKKDLSANDSRPQKDQTLGSKVKVASQQTLDELCAHHQVINVVGNRKRDRSYQEQQCLRTTTATNEEVMYNSGINAAIGGEQRRKALKRTNEVSCTATVPCLTGLRLQHQSPNQIVTRTENSARDSRSSPMRYSNAARTNESAITTIKKNPERHDPFEGLTAPLQEQEQSPSKSSNQSATARNPSHATIVARQNAPASFESSGMPHNKNLQRIESRKESLTTFDERINALKTFKARFGHCNVAASKSASNLPYQSLALWCAEVRYSRRLIEQGKQGKRKLSKAQIEILDALGFQWKFENSFGKRIDELTAFKAKFGHCNVTADYASWNKQYISLGNWCCRVRRSRINIEKGKSGILKLSQAQIESLDALGFLWVRPKKSPQRPKKSPRRLRV